MDEKAHSSTVDGTSTVVNSPTTPQPQQSDAALEAADYLLSHGLTVPYDAPFPGWMMDEPYKLVTPSSSSGDPTDLTTWTGQLPECTIPASVSAPEKWSANDKSLALLRDVCKTQSESEIADYTQQIKERGERTSLLRQLKLELPALRTDEDTDLRRYKRDVALAREVRLTDPHFVLEAFDNDKDEGLDFPPRAYAADARILRSVRDEKMGISKAAFQTLQRCMKDNWSEGDQEAWLASQDTYKGLIPHEPLTPPLTPKLQPQDPFVPDEATCAIPVPSSDPISVLSEDLRKAENRIFDDDGDVPVMSSDMEQSVDTGDADVVELALTSNSILKRDDVKMEPPLLPAVVDGLQAHPSPGFDEIRESIPQDPAAKYDLGCEETKTELNESKKDTAAKVMMEIEQEKLEPFDGSVRVDVPVLDFSIAEPEWCKIQGDQKAMFTSILLESDIASGSSRWSRKLRDESKMGWVMWKARVPKPAIEEPIGDSTLLDRFFGQKVETDVPTSSDFVRKKAGLIILDDDGDDDEEELQPMISPTQEPRAPLQGDWMTLIKKRKLSLDDHGTRQSSTSNDKSRKAKSYSKGGPVGGPGCLLIEGEDGAAATLLDNYLQLHAPKKMKLDQSPFFKMTKPTPVKATHVKETQHANKPRDNALHQQEAPILPVGRLMPCPGIASINEPMRIITAVTLSSAMISHLERLLPGVKRIDRDYSAHNSSAWVPGSVRRAEVVASALADEADLIPSPSTGIVLTTMIKVRQRQIPGTTRSNGNKNPPHLTTRVTALADRYERLVILVSEDNRLDESANDLSPSDAAALVEFQGFAAVLPCETTVLYVGGGVEKLARWTAGMVSRYAAGSGPLRGFLEPEETHWELFLRRAGMNVYAALVVLGMLQAPGVEPVVGTDGLYGLPAFVKMTRGQRLAMFEGMMGGRRVLERVDEVLDARWGGAGGRRQ